MKINFIIIILVISSRRQAVFHSRCIEDTCIDNQRLILNA